MKLTLIQGYYLATPAFFLLDMAFGVRFRVAESLDDSVRLGYYGMCMVFCLLCFLFPRAQRGVAFLESSLNLFALCYAVMVIDFDAVTRGTYQPAMTLGWQSIVTFILAMLIWYWVFKRAEHGWSLHPFERRRR